MRRGGGGTAIRERAGADRMSRRWTVFVNQDGLLLCGTMRALAQLGLLEPAQGRERSVAELCPDLSPTGFGYVRVALRCLASQGWLATEPALEAADTTLSWTDTGRSAACYSDRYVAAGDFLAAFSSTDADTWAHPWTAERTASFLDLLPLALERWRLDEGLPAELHALMLAHLDAALLVPAMLWLRQADLFSDAGPSLPDSDAGQGVSSLLTEVGWMDPVDGKWTTDGRQALSCAVHFGMAASYLPLLARLPDLCRGRIVIEPQSEAQEWHVHRGLNVIASAAAHTRYFTDADDIFLELFNREPVEAQPRFVADMGCGDGSWLVHLYELITQRTLRGQQLDAHPLLMIGFDLNAAALRQARRVLDGAGVPALLLLGDVTDPEETSRSLAEHGLAMQDGLHVRAFIDHNRAYVGAGGDVLVRGSSSGAYVDGRGAPLDGAAVERDFVEHLERWVPHVRQHGLVMLEAHCVAPEVARQHLGATHSVAFDAYHGYSHQFPLEHSAFLHCCQQAGLQPVSHCERRYPARRPFVSVSLNRLLVPSHDAILPATDATGEHKHTWQPEPAIDLEDGRALHKLLYVGGDLRYPRLWCSASTGFVVSRAMDTVEARLAEIDEGGVIRVLDYGAGSGLAAIEFLKACREREIEGRLEKAKGTLELHLVDLPSSWFAQGFELLRDCTWTRFHSLRGADGGFRPLLEVTRGHKMDVVMANMVFHLVPPQALERMATELAGITAPGGRLVWSSPDLGPPGPYAVLFHDANRRLRKRWLGLLEADPDRAMPPRLQEAVTRIRALMTDDLKQSARVRAARRVLPDPNGAEEVVLSLSRHFRGEPEVEFPSHEILKKDILDTLLVPSNGTEYMSEIDDGELREAVIRALLLEEVLPAMQAERAGTAAGLNVQWTLGSFTKR